HRAVDLLPVAVALAEYRQARTRAAAADQPRARIAGDAGAAGSEGGLVRISLRTLHRVPTAPLVGGGVDLEATVHGVAHQPAALPGKRHAVEEAIHRVIAQHLRPVCAAVMGAIDARCVALADAHDQRGVGVEGLHVAKIQCAIAGRLHALPMTSAIDSAQHRALLAARPGDLRIYRGD